jgi:hypothetical protein
LGCAKRRAPRATYAKVGRDYSETPPCVNVNIGANLTAPSRKIQALTAGTTRRRTRAKKAHGRPSVGLFDVDRSKDSYAVAFA